MKTLEFGIGTSLAKILSTLKGVEDNDITVIIPRESPLLENPLNIKILEKSASDLGKSLVFAEGVRSSPNVEEEPNLEPKTAIPSPSVPTNSLPTHSFEEPSSNVTNFNIAPSFVDRLLRFLAKKVRHSGIFLIGGVALLFLLGGYLFLENVPTAAINLYLDNQELIKEITVTGSPLVSEPDPLKKEIPLTPLTATKSSSDSAKTTGKKTVGTSATGTVTLRNYNTVTAKTFPKGTVIKATDALEGAKYILDQVVTVPQGSTSSHIDSSGKKINETDPGRKDATVTSVEVGTKYNASSGQTFVVGTEGFENVNAVASAGLSGGTSKEVTVVSETDVKNLTEKLTKQLVGNVNQEFGGKLSQGQKLVEGFSDTKVLQKDLTHQVGDEAELFGIDMELSVTGYAYNSSELETLLYIAVESSVPEGYEVAQGAEITSEVLKTEDKSITLLAKLNGYAITKVDRENLMSSLKGKSLDQAENFLRSQSNIAGFEIILSPSLPGFLNKIPTNGSKIKIEAVKKSD